MNLSKYSLIGKNVLVTGGAGLLGEEHSRAVLESGANLIITDIDKIKLDALTSNLLHEYSESNITSYILDVSQESNIIEVSNKILETQGGVDVLINNAAIDPKVKNDSSLLESSRLENFQIEDWDMQIKVGLTGAFLCSKIFGSQMAKAKGGVILNIASDLSVIAPNQSLYYNANLPQNMQPVKPVTYSVIKAGLIGLTRYLSTYWTDKKIRCNSLSPGGVFNNQNNNFVENVSKLIPMGRMANKDEYRGAIQFLCSDASSYMNGQNIVIDGGRSVW